MPGDDWILTAFGHLSSERQIGNALGEIPWSARVFYAERAGLDPDVVDALVEIWHRLDTTWLEWQADQVERSGNKGQIGNKTVTKPTRRK